MGKRPSLWEQSAGITAALHQLAPLERAAPCEYLVRVYSVGQRHLPDTRPRLERLLHNPALLRYRMPPPLAMPNANTLAMNHALILT